MKNLLFILSLSFLILFSCSSDGDGDSPLIANDIVLLKSHKGVRENSPSFLGIYAYTYNDNKIDVIYSESHSYYFKYTYTGKFVTKKEKFNLKDELIYYDILTYEDGNLTQITTYSPEDNPSSVVYYTYNKDGTIDATSGSTGIIRYYFSTDRQVSQIDEFNEQGNISSQSFYTYDKNNNPFLNTNQQHPVIRFINNIIRQENIDSDGSVVVLNHNYIYNDKGYPTSDYVEILDDYSFTVSYEYY